MVSASNISTFFLICGESGSGKSTIINKLEKEYKLKQLSSYTTRPQRYKGEKGHIFVHKKEFDLLKPRVAYTKYNNFEYCATVEQVENNDLLTIDPFGIEYFKKNYNGSKNVKLIYIKVEKEERINRMKKRGDNEKDIKERITYDEKAFKNIDLICDLIVENSELELSVDKVYNYIKSFYI